LGVWHHVSFYICSLFCQKLVANPENRNIIFFFITAILAMLVHRHHRNDRDRVVVKREVHRSRHGHSSRSPRRSSHHSHTRRSYV
jgi:hypothetical protein